MRTSEVFREVFAARNLGEAREKLGVILNLNGPVAPEVAARVLADVKFSEKLAAVRKFPDWRDRLLADPMNKAFQVEEKGEVDNLSVPSTLSLVRKSAVSLARWGATGLKTAEPWVLERRMAACNSCPHLIEAPNNIAYRIAGLFTSDRRVCQVCGCLIAKKAMLPEESCPVSSEDDPRFNRWGEFMQKPEEDASSAPEHSSN